MRSFEAKVNIGVYLTLLLFIPLIAFSAYSIHLIVNEQRDVIGHSGAQATVAEQLRSELRTQFALVPAFILTPRSEMIRHMQESHERFLKLVQKLRELGGSDSLSNRILKSETRAYELAAPILTRRLRGEMNASQADELLKNETRTTVGALLASIDELIDTSTRQLADAKQSVFASVNRILNGFAIMTFLTFAFGGTIAILVTKLTRQKRVLDRQRESELTEHRQMANARKEILEVVSHDLKNPLSTIKMATELLQDEFTSETMDRDAAMETLAIAQRSIHSMERLIRDLLDNAKLESGTLELERHVCKLNSLTRENCEPFMTLARAKNIRVEFKLSSDELELNCDRDRIGQVFSNLLGNALKFTPEGGFILIETARVGNQALVRIKDSGPGIAQSEILHIFDRYWQVRETAKQGTGLGLAIVKGIIQAHGTRVWAESKNGSGTTFCFTLPLDRVTNDVSEPTRIQGDVTLNPVGAPM